MLKHILPLACLAALLLNACTATPTPQIITIIITATPQANTQPPWPSATTAPQANTQPPWPSATTAPPTTVVSDTIDWDEAAYYIGEHKTVCGPVVDSHYASSSNGQPTFLNIGQPYPKPNRFTVVIWGRNRSKFSTGPEQLYSGDTICVTGLIEEYRGIPEIEVSDPSQIETR